MTTTSAAIEEYLVLLRDVGLDVAPEDLDVDLDQLPDWDSLLLLKLVVALERAAGRRVAVDQVLQAQSLAAIHDVAFRP